MPVMRTILLTCAVLALPACTFVKLAPGAKQVQVFPVFANGRMQGVRLGAGRDSDLLSRAGLRPTDIVTSVNGIPLDGPARQMELLSALRDARSLQVEVQRDGKPVKIRIGL